MKIEYILQSIFGSERNFHCKDPDSLAMLRFAFDIQIVDPYSGISDTDPIQNYALPIIDVKEMTIDRKHLSQSLINYGKKDKIKVICLVASSDSHYNEGCLCVCDIIGRLCDVDQSLELCGITTDYEPPEKISTILNVYDEDPKRKYKCEKQNLSAYLSKQPVTFFYTKAMP